MDGKIAIEEHFVTPELEDLVLNPGWPADAFRRTLDALADLDRHLEIMDRHGIAMSVLSLASDGIQGIDDPPEAVRRARQRPALPAPEEPARVPARDLDVLSEMGVDRVMFAVDHPFEDVAAGAEWLDAVAIGEADRAKIARLNAEALLAL